MKNILCKHKQKVLEERRNMRTNKFQTLTPPNEQESHILFG